MEFWGWRPTLYRNYLLEWREDEFVSLHEEINQLGETQFYIPGETIDGLEITDQDDDGIFEIAVDGQVYRWDGAMYVQDDES